jgi:hypothetical protein
VIRASHSVPGEWFNAAMPCKLDRDTIATVVVETTGAVDVAFQSLQLRW